MYGWKPKFNNGASGVDIVKSYLMALSDTVDVYDLSDDWESQSKGIDLIWNKRYSMQNVEVKTDYLATKNLFIETVSILEDNKKGWFYTSKADWLLYLFKNDGELYFCTFDELRKINITKFKEVKTTTLGRNGIIYTTKGRIIPCNIFLSIVKGSYKVRL